MKNYISNPNSKLKVHVLWLAESKLPKDRNCLPMQQCETTPIKYQWLQYIKVVERIMLINV